jgi:hypothetical protein
MSQIYSKSIRARLAVFSLAGSVFSYAIPASASDPVIPDLLAPECSTPLDPKEARDTLSNEIIRIDAGQIAAKPNAEPPATLRAQSLVTRAAVSKYDAWLAAKADYDSKRVKAQGALTYLAALGQVGSSISEAGRGELGRLETEQSEMTRQLVAASNAAAVELCRAYAEFDRHYKVVQALHDAPVESPVPPNQSSQEQVAIKTQCLAAIEKPFVTADFSKCLLPDFQTAQATDIPVLERPLRPRGFTAAFSGSQSDTKVSLQFANEFKLREPLIGDGQRYSTWGFSTGIVVDGGTIGDLDEDGKRNNEQFDESIDRINAKAKLTGSLSLNLYPEETAKSWQARAQDAFNSTYKACLKDRASTSSSDSCVGRDLQEWLVAKNADGSYKHATEVESYSNLYFGLPDKTMNARWGGLLNGEIARPSFTYKLAGIEDTERQTNWSLGGAVYRRFGLTQASDLTGVLSLTYKKDWRDYFASDEMLDKTQGPVLHEGFIPAVEGRFLWRGGAWLPATAILPKYTFDTSSDRQSVDIPVLFLFGDKLSSAAGLKWTHAWGGKYDDGPERPTTSEFSVNYQKTFSINPK